ncbi:hypothetical protein ACFYKT_16445 [Cytobacillus sp. FJAT-53684]|uniref:Phosphoserine phosphatase n=1 Tax=Cytobacillus mangrovibacter TaxID=3299024 RepID=A0ABW6K1A1_9BACI
MNKLRSWYSEKLSSKARLYLKCAMLLIVAMIFYSIGEKSASTELSNEKVKYNELMNTINKKQNELSTLEKKKDDLNSEIKAKTKENTTIASEVKENKTAFDEAMKIIENKIAALEEIKTLENRASAKKTEINNLSNDIESKKSELASVSGQIKEKQGAPKKLSAGTFIVGKDIPAGRYKVTPVGRGSNFAVYDSTGNIIENTIISSIPDHGVPEFIVYLDEVNIIKNHSPFLFTPIE